MKFCVNCGKKLGADEKFCTNCGKAYETANPKAEPESSRQEERAQNRKKPSKKMALLLCGIVLLIGIGTGGYFYGKNATGPDAIISDFEKAVKQEDVGKVKKLIESDSNAAKVSDEQVKELISYYKKDPSLFSDTIAALKSQGEQLEDGGTMKAAADPNKNEFLKLSKAGSKWFFFTAYNIQVKPIYAEISSNYGGSVVYINHQKAGQLPNKDESEKFGPYFPGDLQVKVTYEGDYGKIEKKEELKLNQVENNVAKADIELDGTFVYPYSNYDDAILFVNGKSTGHTVGDIKELGPVATDGSITLHAEKSFPEGTIKSKEVIINDSTHDVDLSINYEKPVDDEAGNTDEINSAISQFMDSYLKAGVDAINYHDFSYVESFLAKDGKLYKEGKDYIAYTKKKQITEEFLGATVTNVEELDNGRYKVSTTEEYNITYQGKTTKLKTFDSEYLIREDGASFLVEKLVKTNEVDTD
ncbi:zinc-ribbon domain-containing protein [Fictibacillus sp. Mic-4]|uniref:zinc ribbon domain-containing protein n=1 Tax=Fictibacillus sp. Mic-4 TaxID=3132826 RepID=UPI003CFA54E8